MHAYEMHAHETPAYEMHAHKTPAHEIHANEMHAYETPAYEMHIREMYTREIYAHRSVTFLGGYGDAGITPSATTTSTRFIKGNEHLQPSPQTERSCFT